MTLVYASVSKTNLNYRSQIATYYAVVSRITEDRWHYSWRWPSDRLLSVPESDLFHGEKRSVRSGCESMLLLFCLVLVHRVVCV
jgi:hypothetical protein